jgi:hypothetical protein
LSVILNQSSIINALGHSPRSFLHWPLFSYTPLSTWHCPQPQTHRHNPQGTK